MGSERIDRVPIPGPALPGSALPGSLRVVSQGSGVPLVYLHGTGDAGAMLPVLTRLAERYRVVRPDHPGFIESDDLGQERVADLAGVHLRLLDALAIDRFVLVGCSFGGWVAAELALLAPDRVSELVLIDPAGMPGDGSAPDIFTLGPAETLERTVHDPDRRAAVRAATPDPVVVERLGRSRETARRLAADPYMHDPALPTRAGALRMPVQIVWGREDGIVPLAYADDWTAAVPGAVLHVISDAGHLPHVEQPDEFLAVTRLLERSAAGGRSWN